VATVLVQFFQGGKKGRSLPKPTWKWLAFHGKDGAMNWSIRQTEVDESLGQGLLSELAKIVRLRREG